MWLANGSGTIDRYYDECWSSNSGEHARFVGGGSGINIPDGHLSQCVAPTTVNWQVDNGVVAADCTNCVINGNGNRFFGGSFAGIKDNGTGNKVTATYDWSTQSTPRSFIPVSANREHPTVNALDAGFLISGNSTTPYTSANDLLISCEQMNFVFQNYAHGLGCTPDPTGTEITQSYARTLSSAYADWNMAPTNLGLGQGAGPYGKLLYLGDRGPLTKMNFMC
jgi:hypothetical protein